MTTHATEEVSMSFYVTEVLDLAGAPEPQQGILPGTLHGSSQPDDHPCPMNEIECIQVNEICTDISPTLIISLTTGRYAWEQGGSGLRERLHPPLHGQ